MLLITFQAARKLMYLLTKPIIYTLFSFAKFWFDKFSCDFIFRCAALSINISSSKKFQVKRKRGGDECALIKIRARTMAAAA